MNGNQAMTYGGSWLPATIGRQSIRESGSANSLTFTGVCLLLIGLTVTLSGIKLARSETIGGLLLQPYLVPIGLAFPFVLLLRITKFPVGPLIGWMVFAVSYAIASIGPATEMMSPLSENIKVLAAIISIVTVALLVRSRTDFIFGAAGLVASMAILAFRGLQSEDELAADKLIDVANKNSYSIYALPAVLLVLYIVLRFDWKNVAFKRWFWIPMLVCAGLASYGILAGGNRSGYLGLAFIVFELFVYSLLSPRFKVIGRASAWILITVATASVITMLIWRQATAEFERRYEQTVEGTQSDQLRLDIVAASLRLAMENPLSGKTPQALPYEIGRRLGAKYQEGGAIDTHNVFAHLLGGCGFLCVASLFAIAGMLLFWRPKLPRGILPSAGFYDARNLLRMMLLLWAMRGLFTREILYNPGFCMGIGLAIGLCIVEAGLSGAAASQSSGSAGRTIQPLLTA